MFLLDIAKCHTSWAPCSAFSMIPSGTCALSPWLLLQCPLPGNLMVGPSWHLISSSENIVGASGCSVSGKRRSNGKESGGGSGWTHPLCYSAKPEGWNLTHHSRHGSHWTRLTFGSGVGLLLHLGLSQCPPVVKSWRSLLPLSIYSYLVGGVDWVRDWWWGNRGKHSGRSLRRILWACDENHAGHGCSGCAETIMTMAGCDSHARPWHPQSCFLLLLGLIELDLTSSLSGKPPVSGPTSKKNVFPG